MYINDTFFVALVSVSFLYLLLLLVKISTKYLEFCVICLSVSLTWISLLALHLTGIFSDVTLIALLMGQSITGIFYVAEKMVSQELKIFRLPFLLTLTFIGYYILNLNRNSVTSLLFLLTLWSVFLSIYILRSNRKFREIAARIIECCKNW